MSVDFLEQAPERFLDYSPSAFLEQDPADFLKPAAVTPPTAQVKDDPNLAKVAVGIAAALVVLRFLMKAALANEHPTSAEEIEAAANRIYKRIFPAWAQVAIPAIAQAYRLGSTEDISYAELEAIASDYAAELGQYVHQTSLEALTEGFNAQVNASWSERLAWVRAREAWGLDSGQMRSYVKGLAGAPNAYVTDPVPPASRSAIDRAFLARADRLGANEAFKASQVGRNVVWLSMVASGALPQGCGKRWLTAEDERVCPICGYLDMQEVPLADRFETLGGEKFYAPGVHPNCRCEIELVVPAEEVPEEDDQDLMMIRKDMPGDPYDRKANGEFSQKEERVDFKEAVAFHRAVDFEAKKEAVSFTEKAVSFEEQPVSFDEQQQMVFEKPVEMVFSAKQKAVRAKPKAKVQEAVAFLGNEAEAVNEATAEEDFGPRRHDDMVVIGDERDAITTLVNGDPKTFDAKIKHGDVVHFAKVGDDRPVGFLEHDPQQKDPLRSTAARNAMEHWWRHDGKYYADARQKNMTDHIADEVSSFNSYGLGISDDEPELMLHRHALNGETKESLYNVIRMVKYAKEGMGFDSLDSDALEGATANDLADAILEADAYEADNAYRSYPNVGPQPVKENLDRLAHEKGIDGLEGLNWHFRYNQAVEAALDEHAPRPLPTFYVLDGWYGYKMVARGLPDGESALPFVEGDYMVTKVETIPASGVAHSLSAPDDVIDALAGIRFIHLEPVT